MKRGIAVLLIFLIGLAVGFAKESSSTNQPEIIWSVPSNHLPSSVWVYKFVPQIFSPIILSNLMYLGAFTMNDQTNIEGEPAFRDKRLTYFKSNDGARELGFFPPYGYFYYHNFSAEAKAHELANDVPSDEQTYQRGLHYMQKLGIDCSQLAATENSNVLRITKCFGRRSWFDKVLRTNVETIYMRGIYFRRQIDGIDLTSDGVDFQFGSYGKISRLEVVWRKWEPHELHPTLIPGQLIEELRSGKGKWVMSGPNQSTKRITIYEVQPLYRGFQVKDNDLNNSRFLEPFVRLETHVEAEGTNYVANFDCPIYKANSR